MMMRTVPIILAAVSLMVAGCTDEKLCLAQIGSDASCELGFTPRADNVVTATGTACTTDPNFLIFPHKVIFVIDRSGSNQRSDPAAARADAAQEAIALHAENRAISFAVIGFNDQPEQLTSGFTREVDLLTGAIDDLRPPEGGTEYLDTLDMVYEIISEDAETSPQGEWGGTTYEVHWLSDGIPDPCQDMGAIAGKVDRIMDLKKEFSFFDLRLNTIQLVYPGGDSFCPDGSPADYLARMADRGDGEFQALDSTNLSFEIDFTEIRRAFNGRDFYLVNESRVVWEGELLADSDQDGIPDTSTEMDADPLQLDGNSDGCSDRVDVALLPNPPAVCASSCRSDLLGVGVPADLPDSDFDGLPDCVERMLGTESYSSDHDLDGFPDPLEVKMGTDPIDGRTHVLDTDKDSIPNAQEIRLGLNPIAPDSDLDLAYRYSQSAVTRNVDGLNCFDFTVDNVQLVETVETPRSKHGENRLCIYLVQAPLDDPSAVPVVTQACKSASYFAEEDIKLPANGVVEFVPSDFVPIFEAGQDLAF